MIEFPYQVSSLKVYKIKGDLFPDLYFHADAYEMLQELGVKNPASLVTPIKELFNRYGWEEDQYEMFGIIWIPPFIVDWEQTRFVGRDYFAGWNDLLSGGLLWWAHSETDTYIASPKELPPLEKFELRR